MKILMLVSLALMAAYVRADTVPFFNQLKTCFENNPTDKLKALQCAIQVIGNRQKREMPTQEEVALAKQTRICIDMGNDMKTCLDKLGDKLDKFDIVHFIAVVNHEAVLNELREFLEIYKSGKHTIRETLEIMKQNAKPTGQQQRQTRDSGIGPIDTLLVLKYYVSKCVERNPGENSFTCAVKMFGPDMSKWEEKAKSFAESAKDEASKLLASAKDKASDLKDWFKDLVGRGKRDVAGKVDEIKNAVVNELKEVKDALVSAKDKIEACAKESGKNYFSCAKEIYGPQMTEKLEALKNSVEQKFKETFGRQKREMPTEEEKQLAGQFRICLDMGNDAKTCHAKFADKIAKFDPVHFMAVVNYHAVLEELEEFLAIYKQGGHTIRETLELMKQQRQKRSDVAWMPSSEEVALAKQIKICLDMGKDKDQCYDKILGANKDKFDLVKLDTITKYEDVLRELRQFLAIYNQGGKTIRETLLELHKQQTSVKNRAFNVQSVQDLIDLKTTVLKCLSAYQNKDVTECAVAVFGTQIQGSDKLVLVQQLINHPAVQEFAKGAGQKLHAYLTSLDGMVAKIHNLAHAAFDYVMSYFG